MDYEWIVFSTGLFLFLVLPCFVLLFAYWIGSDLHGIDDEDDINNIGAMDVDEHLKRFKNQ